GTRARLRFGQAAAPEGAPLVVKRAIWAANQLHRKPYVFGGGHKSFIDRGYDCSGTVSYALGAAGLLRSPISSTEFRKFGVRGGEQCKTDSQTPRCWLYGVRVAQIPRTENACRRAGLTRRAAL